MSTVFYFLPKGAKPTPEQLERLKLLEEMPDEDIIFDEDCPPPTDKQVDELDYIMRKYNTRRVTKELWLKEFPEDFQKRKAEAAG